MSPKESRKFINSGYLISRREKSLKIWLCTSQIFTGGTMTKSLPHDLYLKVSCEGFHIRTIWYCKHTSHTGQHSLIPTSGRDSVVTRLDRQVATTIADPWPEIKAVLTLCTWEWFVRMKSLLSKGSSQNVNLQNVNSQNVNSQNVNSQNVNFPNINSQNVNS